MPCPDATNRAGFRSRFEPFMGAPGMDASEFGLTRLCRKLSLRIQAPAVSDRTIPEAKAPGLSGPAVPDRISLSFSSFRQMTGRVKTFLS